jgi:hypothetical protein
MLMLAMLLAACAVVPAAQAQAAAPTAVPAQSQAAAPLGPTFTAARVGVSEPAPARSTFSTDAENAALAQRTGLGKSVALMIVGGAALVTGAIIGGGPGALVAVAGAGVGLYGLYLYLQ